MAKPTDISKPVSEAGQRQNAAHKLPPVPKHYKIHKRPLQKRRPHHHHHARRGSFGVGPPQDPNRPGANGSPVVYVSARTPLPAIVARVCRHLDRAASRRRVGAAGRVADRLGALRIGGAKAKGPGMAGVIPSFDWGEGGDGAVDGGDGPAEGARPPAAAHTVAPLPHAQGEPLPPSFDASEIWLVAAGKAMDKGVRAAAAIQTKRGLDATVAVYTSSVRATDDLVRVSGAGGRKVGLNRRTESKVGRAVGDEDGEGDEAVGWETAEETTKDKGEDRMDVDGQDEEDANEVDDDDDPFGDGAEWESSSRTRMVGVLEVQIRLK